MFCVEISCQKLSSLVEISDKKNYKHKSTELVHVVEIERTMHINDIDIVINSVYYWVYRMLNTY